MHPDSKDHSQYEDPYQKGTLDERDLSFPRAHRLCSKSRTRPSLCPHLQISTFQRSFRGPSHATHWTRTPLSLVSATEDLTAKAALQRAEAKIAGLSRWFPAARLRLALGLLLRNLVGQHELLFGRAYHARLALCPPGPGVLYL